MYCRLIAPKWLEEQGKPRVLEGSFSHGKIQKLNQEGYNVYYLPNHPKNYMGGTVYGNMVDSWNYVFVDYDTKSGTYESKEAFIEAAGQSGILPSRIIDSGNGIHVYWAVTDLDVKSYQRLTRRLMRLLNTDPAVGQIFQLMRVPGTLNTKSKDQFVSCEVLYESEDKYTCEELDKLLPSITPEDELYCTEHYEMIYNPEKALERVNEELPPKFGELLRKNHEAKEIWSEAPKDRSKGDYRLAHILFANGFTRDEALSVLVNSVKAMSRTPVHRASYAQNIVDKIWTHEESPELEILSESVADVLKRSGDTIKGVPFRCHKRIDNTEHGFRLGQVIGLVAGTGVGKTAFSMNMYRWFIEHNPDYHHFFIPLEQPANEIADRWNTICQGDTRLNDKVHILSNYDADGSFRHLSFKKIQTYLEQWQEKTGNKIGCVVIDHIGALEKRGSGDENQDLMSICHSMKAFAIQTNTLLVMQSQTNRNKAGIGDIELDKDAAYGTATFEWYCDYLITMWQPLKRCHSEEGCPLVTAFKFCKIRHKKKADVIKEDVCYYFSFDAETEKLNDMTQDQETSFNYFLKKAINIRKADKKTDLIKYKSVPYNGETLASIESPGQQTRH